ncbi:armadillo repeat only 1 [Hibiscus trionum]|uniref:Armadillo repeat only 1 n=1 Tax=Hibiscus trionum TaxID=183268 RepID=A0A9W7J2T0_HIBTR|nr:armadillo repeat only 1 [Hibiscus trionum]
MAGIVKQLLARPIQVADMVTKAADEAQSFKQECQEIKTKTDKLVGLLRQVARASNEVYERPTRRIVDDTEQVLDKALTLVLKCGATGFLGRLFTIIPAAAFRKLSMQLENSIGDVSWLLAVSGDNKDDEYLGLPPIAANEPILCLIWEQIAILYTGTLEERSDASASLVSLARDNDRYGRLIIEEGGVPPLLKLAKEGNSEGQENAARAIGLLGRDAESVEQIVNAGVCAVFAKILKEGQMKVQSVVAWAVSELAAHHPKCQDHFSQNNIIRFLVSHLAFETVEEHSKYSIATKQSSIHSVVLASKTPQEKENEGESHATHPTEKRAAPSQVQNVVTNTLAVKGKNVGSSATAPLPNSQANHPKGGHSIAGARSNHHPQRISISGTSIKGREFEDPATKAQMKAMAARALWQLCKGNLGICRSVTESRALLCFAILLEKSTDDIRYYSSLALMEITAVAEQNPDLRRSSFKPTAPAAKAVVDQILKIIDQGDSDLLIPCIKTIGNLARTFRATETRVIGPLVKLLDEMEAEVAMEAVIALNKFATPQNYLHVNHSKAIVDASGVKHLIQLVYFGEQMVQFPSLTLLCYIAYNIPDSEVLAQEEVLIVLEWASKQAHLAGNPDIDGLLPEAKSRLELYQSRRGSRGYH